MSVFCISSLKGGVGKTSLAVNIAHAFAKRDCRTLVIDLDPSAHATRFFRKRKSGDSFPKYPPLARIFFRKQETGRFEDSAAPARDELFIVPVRNNLDIIPGGNELRYFVPGYAAKYFSKFPPLLQELDLQYDHILIDTAPEFNILTRSSIAHSDLVVLPVDASEMSIDSVEDLLAAASDFTKARWAIARTMVTSVAYRSHCMSNQRLTERLSFSNFSLATEDGIKQMTLDTAPSENRKGKDLFLLETMIFRTEVQNQLSFLGRTSFDARKTHLLAEQYKAAARELEAIVAARDESCGRSDDEKEEPAKVCA